MAYRFIRNSSLEQELRKFVHTGISQIIEIGDGILAVKIDEHYDIYFDTGRWELKITLKKEFRSTIFPFGIQNTGVLPGRHFKGGAGNKDRIILIVRQKLAPRGSCYKLVTDKEDKERKTTPTIDPMFGDIFGDILKSGKK